MPPRILDEFRGRGWMPLEPKLLDYQNTQFLLIGHHEDSLEKATVPQPDDEKTDKEEPKAEMEKLEHEDDVRVQHLKGKIICSHSPPPPIGQKPVRLTVFGFPVQATIPFSRTSG